MMLYICYIQYIYIKNIELNMLRTCIRMWLGLICPCLTVLLWTNEAMPTCAGMVMPSKDYLGLTGD